MADGKSFRDLAARTMSPERIERAEVRVAAAMEEMDLAEIRRFRILSQETIAQTLQVGQAAVAKLEKRTDMYLSTLRRFIEAAGGELEITARFADRVVRIKQISDVGGQIAAAE